jgi:hypothetical protein
MPVEAGRWSLEAARESKEPGQKKEDAVVS